MSNFDAVRTAITEAFQAAYIKPGGLPFLPTAFENQAFNQPEKQPWAKFAIRLADRENSALGRGEQRTPGFFALQVFLPENGGTRPAYQSSDKLSAAFDNLTLPVNSETSVIFRTVSIRAIGRVEAGWFQFNITANLQVDEGAPFVPDVTPGEPGEADLLMLGFI